MANLRSHGVKVGMRKLFGMCARMCVMNFLCLYIMYSVMTVCWCMCANTVLLLSNCITKVYRCGPHCCLTTSTWSIQSVCLDLSLVKTVTHTHCLLQCCCVFSALKSSHCCLTAFQVLYSSCLLAHCPITSTIGFMQSQPLITCSAFQRTQSVYSAAYYSLPCSSVCSICTCQEG